MARNQNLSPTILNKQARRNYEIVKTFEAGIELRGSEVKSIRQGSVNLKESYIRIKSGEAFLIGCHISPYTHSRADAHDVTRERKLLLKKREIERLDVDVRKSGLSLVPLKLYFNKDGRCKLELALGKGKKLFDKREDVKKKETQRQIERALR